MKIEKIALAQLVPYAQNARTHSAAQVQQIADSIHEFGWTNPVLIDGTGGIIAGHGRTLAAKLLGMTEVPCIRLTHLTEAQKRAYIIADNKLALNAGWDEEMLAKELSTLVEIGYDVGRTGFDADELAKLLGEEDLAGSDEPRPDLAEKWEIAIECSGESEQVALLGRFKTEGLKCRALTF